MDATHIPNHLIDLDQQIADVESRLATARKFRAQWDNAKGPIAKRLDREIAALAAKHEQLVRRVQWATVGAAKPGEVL